MLSPPSPLFSGMITSLHKLIRVSQGIPTEAVFVLWANVFYFFIPFIQTPGHYLFSEAISLLNHLYRPFRTTQALSNFMVLFPQGT